MKKQKRLICAWALWMDLLILGMLTGCAGGAFYGLSGPDWYGPEYDDFYGDYNYPGYYGSVWGPDALAFGRHDHGGFDRDFGRRGFMSLGHHCWAVALKPLGAYSITAEPFLEQS